MVIESSYQECFTCSVILAVSSTPVEPWFRGSKLRIPVENIEQRGDHVAEPQAKDLEWLIPFSIPVRVRNDDHGGAHRYCRSE